MIMIVKSIKYPFILFSYSNLSDWLLDLSCDTVLTYTAYIVEHYLSPNI